MLILALETSLGVNGVALLQDNRILGEVSLNGTLTQSQTLLVTIDFLLKKNRLNLEDLSCIVVTVGPGYFTGIRIGIATAQGLAIGLGLPIIEVSTLRLMATTLVRPNFVTWAILKAHRNFVYAAPFFCENEGLKRLKKDMSISFRKLLLNMKGKILLVGDVKDYKNILKISHDEFKDGWLSIPRPGLLAFLGYEKFKKGSFVLPDDVKARYCRPSDAEVNFGIV